MTNKPQLYKFSDIEHRLHTLEPRQKLYQAIRDECGQ